MNIYERIDGLLDERGLSKRQMCLGADISYNSYMTSYRRKSAKMPFDRVKAIAEFLNVPVNFLLDTETRKSTIITEDIDVQHFKAFQKLTDEGKNKVTEYVRDILPSYSKHHSTLKNNKSPERMLPLYEYPASAGRGVFVGEGEYELAPVPTKAPANTSFGIRISGESMEPKIPDGSIAWVCQQPDVYEGQICIVVINDEGYCKVKRDRIFESLNRNYKDIVPDVSDEVNIVGLVVHIQPPDQQ